MLKKTKSKKDCAAVEHSTQNDESTGNSSSHDRITIAATFDINNNAEHILIGTWQCVLRAIRTDFSCTDYGLIHNKIRPLGTFLLEVFNPNLAPDGACNMQNYAIIPKMPSAYYENAVSLLELLKCGENLATCYTAMRIEEERRKNEEADFQHGFLNDVEPIVLPFRYSWKEDVPQIALSDIYSGKDRRKCGKNIKGILGADYFDHPGYLVYGNGAPLREWIVSDYTISPLIVAELLAIGKKGHIFRMCTHCKRFYLTTINHKGFCSEDCRKAAAQRIRKEYNQRAAQDDREENYKNSYMYCYRRLKRMDKKHVLTPEQMIRLEEYTKTFRKDALRKKKAAKDPEKRTEFIDFLRKGEQGFDDLMNQFLVGNR